MLVTIINLLTGESDIYCKAEAARALNIKKIETMDNWNKVGNIKFYKNYIVVFKSIYHKQNKGRHMKQIGSGNLIKKY